MRNLEDGKFREHSRELETFKPSTELLEVLNNDKSCISSFREDTKRMVARLHLSNPKFVAQLKKYLKDKTKDKNNSISINDYLKRADIIDFQETLDKRSKIEDDELKEEMIELSSSCSTILELLEEEKDDIVNQKKKEKKERKQFYRQARYREDEDEYKNIA